MAQRASFKIDKAGLDRLLFGDAFAEVAKEGAERIADAAREMAPVDSGRYQSSIKVVEDQTDRVVYRVVADVPYALEVEWRYSTLTAAMISEAT